MDQTDTRTAPRVEREHYAWWRGVRVTESVLTVGDRAFHVRELRRLREQPGRPQPVRQAVIGVAFAQAAVVVFALAALAYVNGLTATACLVAAVQALTTTMLVAVALVRWPTPTELWAHHRGVPTMLYRCPDRFEFGKVRRAVERAMQAQRLLK